VGKNQLQFYYTVRYLYSVPMCRRTIRAAIPTEKEKPLKKTLFQRSAMSDQNGYLEDSSYTRVKREFMFRPDLPS